MELVSNESDLVILQVYFYFIYFYFIIIIIIIIILIFTHDHQPRPTTFTHYPRPTTCSYTHVTCHLLHEFRRDVKLSRQEYELSILDVLKC